MFEAPRRREYPLPPYATAASAGCAPIISSLDLRSSSSTDRLRKMRKYGRAVAEIEPEAVVGGMLNRTLMQVLSVSSKRPPDKLPPGIKETADPAVTAIGAASPLLAIAGGEFIFCVKPDHILPAWRRMR